MKKIEESLPYTRYLVENRFQSLIDPWYEGVVEVGFVCPHCKIKHPTLEHGNSMTCSCGLIMTRAGNSLLCTLIVMG